MRFAMETLRLPGSPVASRLTPPAGTFSLGAVNIKLNPVRAWLALIFIFSPMLVGAADLPVARVEVKLLTIGNSFADNSTHFLPQLAAAGGKTLVLFKANLGGHSLQQHAGYLQAFEADPKDPKGSPYQTKIDPATGQKHGQSLRDALASAPWDFVTIQQASPLSPLPATYQPYAGILVAYIHRYAPQAKILIHETWAYPDDCPRYQDPKLPYLKNPQVMYQNVRASYAKLAADTGLVILPVGDAFNTVLAGPDPLRLHRKADIHANANGEYLGAAVFYEMIYGERVIASSYLPPGVSAADAARLRDTAHATVVQAAKE